MKQERADLKEVAELASKLSPRDRVRLIGLLAPSIERDMAYQPQGPRKSLLGICVGLGSAPSAEDIDEARREEWANFPREDI